MRSGCDGGGKGALIGDELSHTLATNNDQTIVSIHSPYSFDTRKTTNATVELSPTLISTDYKGGKAVCYGVAGATVNAEISKEIQPTLKARNQGDSYICFENHGSDSRIKEVEVAPVISARAGTGGGNLPLVQNVLGFIKNDAGGEQQGYWNDVFPTVRSQVTPAVAIAETIIGRQVKNGGNGVGAKEEISYTLNSTGVHGVAYSTTVRRLLPIECERLMAMPDDYTQISWKGLQAEQCPDAPRYKAIGNSMAVNVMIWIGERIDKVENEINANMS